MFKQPAVQMYFFSIFGESVVRKNQITIFARPAFDLSADIPDKAVQSPIPVLHHVHTIMKEHVLDAIKVIEDAGQHAFAKFIHQTVQNLNAPLKDFLTKIKKMI